MGWQATRFIMLVWGESCYVMPSIIMQYSWLSCMMVWYDLAQHKDSTFNMLINSIGVCWTLAQFERCPNHMASLAKDYALIVVTSLAKIQGSALIVIVLLCSIIWVAHVVGIQTNGMVCVITSNRVKDHFRKWPICGVCHSLHKMHIIYTTRGPREQKSFKIHRPQCHLVSKQPNTRLGLSLQYSAWF